MSRTYRRLKSSWELFLQIHKIKNLPVNRNNLCTPIHKFIRDKKYFYYRQLCGCILCCPNILQSKNDLINKINAKEKVKEYWNYDF